MSGALLAPWLGPGAALALTLGTQDVFTRLGVFFSQMAVVTFGGTYAVLTYVAQAAVETHGWLSAGEMLDGLRMAETTPGPLILVLQFVGFLAGHDAAAGGFWGGAAGALLTLWVTFAPCFAWIFLGAPFVERLHDQPRLKGALAGVTAAVVGVIANLALWFGLRVLFGEVRRVEAGPLLALDAPVLSSLDPAALFLAALAAFCLFRARLGVVATLGAAALAGLAVRSATGG